jgi:hypothetical protein
MWTLWLIVSALLFAISMYILGRLGGGNEDDKMIAFWIALFGSLLWPTVLAAVIIFGPFYGLFWLGDYHREKRKEKSSANK